MADAQFTPEEQAEYSLDITACAGMRLPHPLPFDELP
jgi:hypothetical protein